MALENLPQLPTVGRVVYIRDIRYPDQTIGAFVTAVIPDMPGFNLNATAFTPNGSTVPYFSIPHVDSQPEGWQGAAWYWPVRA